MISYGGEDGRGLIFLTVGFLGTSLGYCNGSTSGASLGVLGGGEGRERLEHDLLL